ncbi:FHA domain containing protein [Tolypothrix tenuis PCC 7101]|uniref:FHA domain containing protein n=1 Tax=Tolypothrix tenuis PCC 7101 TaxID=231146 RepID=A0A1Z4N283_9CYAN|nr:FHA domain-containing protein [Aulosira sp. FACHB-113]BAY99829.1 FHA domain containing protein [Tolypothrix tenuis PCC 7101]BAZ76249.1 FHA domain containing protein [Aulosira laxa NIES-50]
MITCSACGYDQNPDGAEFCDACGSELQEVATTVIPSSQAPTVIQPQTPPPPPQIPQPSYSNPIPITPSFSTSTATTARLIAKQPSSPTPEFFLDSNAIVGIFDPDMGPVDIDLESFSGGDTVSRNHAEVYQEAGVWKIKDLGSTNGIFIKPAGQTRFAARITLPETLNSGDEIAFGKVRFLFQSP